MRSDLEHSTQHPELYTHNIHSISTFCVFTPMLRIFILVLFCTSPLLAQKKQVKVYYDGAKKKIQEDYYVLEENDQVLDGPYKRYYTNGKLEMEGAYKNGNRSGAFIDIFPSGTVQRKISYLDGMRHGPVEVYDETGTPIQKALYRNNQLVDSIKSFYSSGITKHETVFVKGKPDGLMVEYILRGK